MADLQCYWSTEFRCWVLTVHDAEGNQLWEADYFPHREALAYALKHF